MTNPNNHFMLKQANIRYRNDILDKPNITNSDICEELYRLKEEILKMKEKLDMIHLKLSDNGLKNNIRAVNEI